MKPKTEGEKLFYEGFEGLRCMTDPYFARVARTIVWRIDAALARQSEEITALRYVLDRAIAAEDSDKRVKDALISLRRSPRDEHEKETP